MLRRILDHTGAGSEAGVLTRAQFHETCHLIYATLRVAQDQMFQSDALWAAASKLVTPGAKARGDVGPDAGGDDWTIQAAPAQGPSDSVGTLAREQPQATAVAAAAAAPAPAMNFLAGPLEEGAFVLSRENSRVDLAAALPLAPGRPASGATSSVGPREASPEPGASEVAASEHRLQVGGGAAGAPAPLPCHRLLGRTTHRSPTAAAAPLQALQSQLASRAEGLRARGLGEGRLAQLQSLEAEVRRALEGGSSPGEGGGGAGKGTPWEAFNSAFGTPAMSAQPSADAGAPSPLPQQQEQVADVWDALVQRPEPTPVAAAPAAAAGPPEPSPFAELNPFQPAAVGGFQASWPSPELAPLQQGQGQGGVGGLEQLMGGLQLPAGEPAAGDAAAAADAPPGLDADAIAAVVHDQVMAMLRPHLAASVDPLTARGDFAAAVQRSTAAVMASAAAQEAAPAPAAHLPRPAAMTARPAPAAAAAVWEPMPAEDRQRCEALFVHKVWRGAQLRREDGLCYSYRASRAAQGVRRCRLNSLPLII